MHCPCTHTDWLHQPPPQIQEHCFGLQCHRGYFTKGQELPRFLILLQEHSRVRDHWSVALHYVTTFVLFSCSQHPASPGFCKQSGWSPPIHVAMVTVMTPLCSRCLPCQWVGFHQNNCNLVNVYSKVVITPHTIRQKISSLTSEKSHHSKCLLPDTASILAFVWQVFENHTL